MEDPLTESQAPEDRPMQLTSEELRNRIYLRFSRYGVIDDLRAQIRQKLSSEMRKTSALAHTNQDSVAFEHDMSKLPFQISNWLVLDHLQRCSLPCTLSTFLTESGSRTSSSAPLNIEDLLIRLSLTPDSLTYKKLKEEYMKKENKGFLCSIIKHLLLATEDHEHQPIYAFSGAKPEHYGTRSIDDTFLERQEELHRIEHTVREELKREYEKKEAILLEQEQNLRAEMQKEKQMHDQELSSQRQILLREIDLLKTWKDEQQRELERRKSHLQVEEDKLLQRIELFKRKEKSFQNMEQIIEEKVAAAKVEFTLQVQQKVHQIEKLKNELNLERERVTAEDQRFASLKEQLQSQVNMVTYLQKENDTIRKKYSEILEQNAALMEELGEKSDYSLMKLEMQKLHKEQAMLHQRFEETELELQKEKEENRQLSKELSLALSKPSREVLQLQQELNKHLEIQKLNEAVWNESRQKLQRELEETKQKYDGQLSSYDEHQKQIQSMKQGMEELKIQFNQLLQELRKSSSPPIRKEKELHGNAAALADVTEASENTAIHEPIPNPPLQGQQSMVQSDKTPNKPATAPSLQEWQSDYPGIQQHAKTDPLEYIAYAKQRITQLQLEADTLGKKYKTFLEEEMSVNQALSASIEKQKSVYVSTSSSISEMTSESYRESNKLSQARSKTAKIRSSGKIHLKSRSQSPPSAIKKEEMPKATELNFHLLDSTYSEDKPKSEISPVESEHDKKANKFFSRDTKKTLQDKSDSKAEQASKDNASTSKVNALQTRDTKAFKQDAVMDNQSELKTQRKMKSGEPTKISPKQVSSGNSPQTFTPKESKSKVLQPNSSAVASQDTREINLDDVWKTQQPDIRQGIYRYSSSRSLLSSSVQHNTPGSTSLVSSTRSNESAGITQTKLLQNATNTSTSLKGSDASSGKPDSNKLEGTNKKMPSITDNLPTATKNEAVSSNKYEDHNQNTAKVKSNSQDDSDLLDKSSKIEDNDKNRSDGSDLNISVGSIAEDILQDDDDEW